MDTFKQIMVLLAVTLMMIIVTCTIVMIFGLTTKPVDSMDAVFFVCITSLCTLIAVAVVTCVVLVLKRR
jgi:hypothetical protein